MHLPKMWSPGRKGEDVTTFMDSLIPRLGQASSLTNMSLFVFDDTIWTPPTMSIALHRFPSLKTLTIGISGSLVVSPGSTLHPNVRNRASLERINIIACNLGVECFLAWVMNQLRNGVGLRRLKVAVKRCEHASKVRLLKIHCVRQTGV